MSAPVESLSEHIERLLGRPDRPKKLKPKQKYEDLREKSRAKRA